ncbi:FAD/NAD(P)-binding domain-containing protein [Stipitochalara longipes BDJ]|nr:FAD/NAD(P)-binding domain-containing protein [Stipitochalara longipes BDJ]
MSSNHIEDTHVLIIRAGITSLLLAQGLKKHGIKVSIFETERSAAEHRPGEWAMGLHWALPQLQSLLPDIRLRTNTTQPDPDFVAKDTDTFSLYNGETGEPLKLLTIGGMRRFSRTKLRVLISEGIEVRYGKTLSSISYGNEESRTSAHFADGTSVRRDALIGADGPRSKVRDLVVGEGRSEASPAGVVVAIVRSKYTAEQALKLRQHASLTSVAFHPNGPYTAIFGQDFQSSEPENWEFQTMHSSMPKDFKGSDSDKLRLLKSRAAEYVGIWKNAFHRVDFDNKGGRATLAGDAAHPMTPQRGQGLNYAICDVANLVAALTKAQKGELSLNDAVREYDAEMLKRGGNEVQEALLNAKMIHDWNSILQSPSMTSVSVQ